VTAGTSWLAFVAERWPELWLRTGEHLMLTGVSTALAILVGSPWALARPGSAGSAAP
jgi:ABC-type proline/glycine betaine transport system permease subunit